MQNIIKLRISGNPNSQGGFNALINKGVIPQGIIEEDRPFPISDNPGICLCHKDDQILYVLHDSKVVPSDAERDGRLTILMSIPKGFTIQNGTSPYEVLMEIYKFFVDNCMTPIEGSEVKRFKTMDAIFAQSEDCKAILNKYELEKGSLEYYTMATSGTAATLNVPTSKLNEFFSDTQYPEFRTYKEIYITTQGKSSEALAGIKIPREKEYEIWVNERFQSKGTLLTTTPIQSSGGLNTEDITYDPVSVTLQELIEAEGNKLTFGQSTAELNLKTRRISLTVPPIKVYFKLEFKFDGDSEGIKKLKRNLESGNCKLLLGLSDISNEISNPNPQIAPSKTKNAARITGTIDGFLVSVNVDRDIVDKKAVVKFNITKRPIPASIRTTTDGGGRRINNQLPAQQQTQTTSHTQPQQPVAPPVAPPKKFNLLIGFVIGVVIGLTIGVLIGYNSNNSEDEFDKFKAEKNGLNSQIDSLKGVIFKLKEDTIRLNAKNTELQDQINNNNKTKGDKKPTKTETAQQKKNPLEAINENYTKEEIDAFMALVNDRDYKLCTEHDIFKTLRNDNNLKVYAYKIEYFCQPEKLFDGEINTKGKNKGFNNNGLKSKPNKDQEAYLKQWKKIPAVGIEDIKIKVDKLLKTLKTMD